jgi:peptide/nickel transport system ATP-binding protein
VVLMPMSESRNAILSLSGVSVSYGRARSRRTVLNGIDLAVSPGEIVGLIGETGSGKSTVARATLGLVSAAGSISIDGTEVTTLTGNDRREFRRRGVVQYVFQDALLSLDPDVVVGESISEGLRIRESMSDPRLDAVVAEALITVGLAPELALRLPGELSGGQRQRVAIARTLVVKPKLLILDEPVSALDAANRIQILELLKKLRDDQSMAQLFISHDLGSVAGIADRIAVLHNGRIVEEGETSAIVTRPRHPYTRLLIGSAPTLASGAADRDQRQALRRALNDAR